MITLDARAKIERIDRTLDADICRVRLSDGRSIRMNATTAQTLVQHTNGYIDYSIDAVGNCYNPRPAGAVKP